MSEPERIFTAEDLIKLNREVLGYGGGRHGGVRYESGLLIALDKPWFAFVARLLYIRSRTIKPPRSWSR